MLMNLKMMSNISIELSDGETEKMDGTSPAEVLSLTFFVPICSLLISIVASACNFSTSVTGAIEMFTVNLILLLALTCLSEHLWFLISILTLLLLIAVFSCIDRKFSLNQIFFLWRNINEILPEKDFSRNFVGDYRGHLLLATSICILAVDFTFFPGRFAKTETYGWSIMDAGVGSFVLVHGLCSPHAWERPSKLKNFKKNLITSFPLLLLGIARLVLTTAVNYHKAASEYGIHWNFFFTLAFTKIICYNILTLCPAHSSGFLAVVTIVLHQLLLSQMDLTLFVLSDARDTFIRANKEGIVSLLGFISLYFFGVQLGSLLWRSRYKLADYAKLLLMLCGVGVCGWIFMYLSHVKIQAISRRMANLTYCVWVVSLTSLQLAIHLAHRLILVFVSNLFKKSCTDFLLWKAINYNGLFYFLLANILTGLVNLAIWTDDATDNESLAILILYLTILSVTVVMFYKHSIQLKF
ncbi:phosphatidylinositol-glycan biosynthesis class W protein-like isoform X2 [Stegodyphus dumicola]|uniref:phosphatidylinositol-glycan biosynthesis class W protein-like isoform X2 n=1 Tax=Stegodyphus dumicola TaxID=202533 RepID=UPI0015AD2CAE|nr:phosphatidylinositol-glycan biosynthesis class W protein-like isoform X2 [Stegodyphus dumicola]